MLELSQKQFSIKPWEILEKMGGHTVTRLNNFTVFNTMDSIVLLIILDVKTYDENYLHK